MTNPNMTTQITETDWVDNVERLKSIQAAGRIQNPLFYMPLLNSLIMIRGTGTVEFTRDSVATYIDRYGVVQNASVDQPRFEKNGLLIEGASTNEFRQSGDLTTSWITTRSTLSAAAADGPDGVTNSAEKLVDDADAGTTSHYMRQLPITGPGDNVIVAISFIVKPAEFTWIHIGILDKAGGVTNNSVYFDIANGVVGTVGSLVHDYRMEELSDGYYRCWVASDVRTGGSTPDGRLHLATGDGQSNYISGAGGNGIYWFHGQWEELPFASSCIDTTTVAVTRNAEFCDATFSGNTPIKNSPISIFADTDLLGDTGTWQHIIYTPGELHRNIAIYSNPGGFLEAHTNLGTLGLYGGVLDAGITHRIGGVRDETSKYALFFDGVKQDEVSDETTTGNGTSLSIGGVGTGATLYGHISNLRIYNVALTDREMTLA